MNQEYDNLSDLSRQPESKFSQIIRFIEEVFFTIILVAIVLLGLAPIVLRSYFDTGISWAEPLSRQLVLWLALFGAGAATRDRKHITIDIIANFVPLRWKLACRSLTEIVSSVICGILCRVSITFVLEEREYGFKSSITPSIPEWIFELVLPVGFLLLTLRLLIAGCQDAYRAIRFTDQSD